MQLLDLPPELFQRIIHQLVNDYGSDNILDALNLRSVCRTFAREIEHDIFSKQSSEVVSSIFIHCSEKFYLRHAWKYLFYLVKSNRNRDCVVSKRIEEMVDYLVTVRGLDAQLKDAYTEALCATAVYYQYPARSRFAEVLRLPVPHASAWIYDYMRYPLAPIAWAGCQAETTTEMKLAAAAAVGDAGLVADLLPYADFLKYNKFDILGDPFSNAAMRRHDHIIKVILDYLHPEVNFANGSWKSGNYEGMARYYANALNWDRMLHCGDEKYFKTLIQTYKAWTTIRDPYHYRVWLRLAVIANDARMVTVLLDIGIETTSKPSAWILLTQAQIGWVLKDGFEQACCRRKAGLGAVEAYIHHPNLGPNYLFFDGSTPLGIAASTGSKPHVLAILNAGAFPDGVEGSEDIPIMEAAAYRYSEIFDLLVSHGADASMPERYGFSFMMRRKICSGFGGVDGEGADEQYSTSVEKWESWARATETTAN
ncbi:uncharacterized protein N0V89_000127 [Didymosphaeria variabile]|uniref:Uncharacterized protein n=1 Tax=Didymosphaeria variabile TaxID=1932322 RepID=A0A9W8XTN6_9PLEO|nr:uncharacterized protein N0V89_000127 [Didymosphaeria variabile]KAJ4359572.1 hypothetical protein N0V89_000127 [Didymosphaeria variabile]